MGKDKDDNSWYQFKDEMRDISKPLNIDQKEIETKLIKLGIPADEILFAVRGYQASFSSQNRSKFWTNKEPHNDYATPFEELVRHFIPNIVDSEIPLSELIFKTAFDHEIVLFIISGCKSGHIKTNNSPKNTDDLKKSIVTSINYQLKTNPIYCKVANPKIKNKGKNDPFMKKQRDKLKDMKANLKNLKKTKAAQDKITKSTKQIENFEKIIDNLQKNYNLGYSLDEELYLPEKLGKAITKLYHEAQTSKLYKVKLQDLIEYAHSQEAQIKEHEAKVQVFIDNITKAMEITTEGLSKNPYAKIRMAEKKVEDVDELSKSIWKNLKPTIELILTKEDHLKEKIPNDEFNKKLNCVLEIRDFYANSQTQTGANVSKRISGFLKQRHLIKD
jgi:hypothetical protein